MGTQGPGRKRIPNKGLTAEEDALNVIAREAEARLAAKRAARAEAREIRMKELERQQKEIYQVQKKYYGLDNNKDSKWGDIEQWMEDSERYSRPARKQTSLSDDEERMSVSSRGSVRSDLDAVGAYGGLGSELGSTSSHSHKKSKKKKKKHSKTSNGCDDDYSMLSGWSSKLSDDSRVARSKLSDESLVSRSKLSDESRVSRSKLSDESWAPRSKLSDESRVSRSKLSDESWAPRSKLSDESRVSRSKLSDESWASRSSRLDLQPGSLGYRSADLYSNSSVPSSRLPSSGYNGYQPSLLHDTTNYVRRRRGSLYDESLCSSSSTRRLVAREIVDDRLDRDYLEKGSRASTLSSATLASLGGSSSRRGSGDTSITADTENSVREIKEIHELKDQIQDVESKYLQSLKEVKDALAEMEEKYRKAMVSNAQLDNEKCNLMYQVDVQKDSLTELEELLSESRREYEDKTKELEREKHAHSILQFQFSELKQTLKASEELLTEIRQLNLQHDGFRREVADLQETLEWKDKKIGALERQKEYTDAIRNERDELRDEVVQLKDILKKHGIVLGPDLNPNGEMGEGMLDGTGDAKTSPTEGTSVLEIRLRKLVDERENLIEQVKNLKTQLDQRKLKNGSDIGSSPEGDLLENGGENLAEVQRDANRLMSELKFKLVKSEQECTALEQNVSRLEGQVTRYKSASENAEKIEDELKAEKRKLQRELRSALDKVDELEASHSLLNKRLEKIKAGRGNATSPQ